MLLTKSPQGASLSVYYEVRDFEKIVVGFIQPLLQKIDPAITIEMTEGENDLYLYINEFTYSEEGKYPYSSDTLHKIRELGFSEDGYENLENALRLMCPGRVVSFTVDVRQEGVIVEFGGEGSEILRDVEKLFNDIDNLNREETAQRVGVLYKKLKELNWK